jgi:hypothetical protein
MPLRDLRLDYGLSSVKGGFGAVGMAESAISPRKPSSTSRSLPRVHHSPLTLAPWKASSRSWGAVCISRCGRDRSEARTARPGPIIVAPSFLAGELVRG